MNLLSEIRASTKSETRLKIARPEISFMDCEIETEIVVVEKGFCSRAQHKRKINNFSRFPSPTCPRMENSAIVSSMVNVLAMGISAEKRPKT